MGTNEHTSYESFRGYVIGDSGDTDEQELVDRIRAGDLSAFDTLYLQYHSKLLEFSHRYVGRQDVAEDIVQEVMLGVWRGRHTWRITHGVGAYLFGAVRKCALQIGRREGTAQRLLSSMSVHDLPGGHEAPLPNVEVEGRDVRRVVREALDHLSEIQRQVLLLRWRDGMTSEQIGAVLGISASAAKKQAQRAEAALRAQLEHLI